MWNLLRESNNAVFRLGSGWLWIEIAISVVGRLRTTGREAIAIRVGVLGATLGPGRIAIWILIDALVAITIRLGVEAPIAIRTAALARLLPGCGPQ